MAAKPKRIIYWIGGNLSRTERQDEWIPYGAKLQEHHTRMGGADSGYAFEWVSRCTAKQFAEIWSDPNTYGIFWYSHGEALSSSEFSGYPLAYDIYLDESWRGRPTGKRWDAMRLDPKQLPKPSPNLRFVAIKSCGSGKLRNEWQRQAPGVTIVTHQGQLFRRESSKYGSFDQMLKWIVNKPGIFLEGKPSDGAGHLFELLPKPKKEGRKGRNIGVQEYWTSTQGSAAGPPAAVVARRRFATGSTNPLRQIWQEGIGAAPLPPVAWRPRPATPASNPLRQMWEQGIAHSIRPPSLPAARIGQGTASTSPLQRTRDRLGGTFQTGPKTTWRPGPAVSAINPLRERWEMGTRSTQPAWRPHPTAAGNPLRQMWEQGVGGGAQSRSPTPWRPDRALASNPLRQMWQGGLRHG